MKMLKWLLMAGMVTSMCLALAGCSDSDDDRDPLVATWSLQSVGGQPVEPGLSGRLVFNGNGTFSYELTMNGNVVDSDRGTWSADGGVLTTTDASGETERISYSVVDRTLTIGQGRDALVFTR